MLEAVEFTKLALATLGIPATLIAIFKGISEIKNGNHERQRENRHKQAAAAKDALKDIFESAGSRAAMQMIDWSGRSYQDANQCHIIGFEEIPIALRITNLKFTEKERFIRDCFEEFFDKIQLLEHYVSIRFLNFDDLAIPLAYYAGIIIAKIDEFRPFLDTYGYADAKKFLTSAAKGKSSHSRT